MSIRKGWFRSRAAAAVVCLGIVPLAVAGCVSGPKGLFSNGKPGESGDEVLKTSYEKALDDEKTDVTGRVRITTLGDGAKLAGVKANSPAADDADSRASESSLFDVISEGGSKPLNEDENSEQHPRESSTSRTDVSNESGPASTPLVRTIPDEASTTPTNTSNPTVEKAPAMRAPTPQAASSPRNSFAKGFDSQYEELRETVARTQAEQQQQPKFRQIPDFGAPQASAEPAFPTATASVETVDPFENPIETNLQTAHGQIAELIHKADHQLADGQPSAAYRTARSAVRLAANADLQFAPGELTPDELVRKARNAMRSEALTDPPAETRFAERADLPARADFPDRNAAPAIQLQRPVLEEDGSSIEIVPLGPEYVPQDWRPRQGAVRQPPQWPVPVTTEQKLQLLRQRLEFRDRAFAAVKRDMIVDTDDVPSRLDGSAVDFGELRTRALPNGRPAKSGAGYSNSQPKKTTPTSNGLPPHSADVRPPSRSSVAFLPAIQRFSYPATEHVDSRGNDAELAGYSESAPSPPRIEVVEDEAAEHNPFENAHEQLDDDPTVAAVTADENASESNWLPTILVLCVVGLALVLGIAQRRRQTA